ncbi:MAG: hypothetical protein AAF433_05955 [Bacteroidota bacterium]
MLKKILLLLLLIGGPSLLMAQEDYRFHLALEAGIPPLGKDPENLGLLFNIEPKVKVSPNSFLGLRIGLALNTHVYENIDPFEYFINPSVENAVLSFVPNLEYYLNNGYNRPYLGFGIGVYVLPDYLEVFPSPNGIPIGEFLEGNVNLRPGLLLRGGVERGNLRIGLEYNLTPKADIKINEEEVIGQLKTSYFGLTLGLLIRAGKE